MLNHITIMGRFVRDPELRRTGSGVAVASFTLAVASACLEVHSEEVVTSAML